jgi:hypothetical protein
MPAESRIEHACAIEEGHSDCRRKNMPEQFVHENSVKVDKETVSNETPQQRIDRVANELAMKPSRTEKKFDKENSTPFSK